MILYLINKINNYIFFNSDDIITKRKLLTCFCFQNLPTTSNLFFYSAPTSKKFAFEILFAMYVFHVKESSFNEKPREIFYLFLFLKHCKHERKENLPSSEHLTLAKPLLCSKFYSTDEFWLNLKFEYYLSL